MPPRKVTESGNEEAPAFMESLRRSPLGPWVNAVSMAMAVALVAQEARAGGFSLSGFVEFLNDPGQNKTDSRSVVPNFAAEGGVQLVETSTRSGVQVQVPVRRTSVQASPPASKTRPSPKMPKRMAPRRELPEAVSNSSNRTSDRLLSRVTSQAKAHVWRSPTMDLPPVSKKSESHQRNSIENLFETKKGQWVPTYMLLDRYDALSALLRSNAQVAQKVAYFSEKCSKETVEWLIRKGYLSPQNRASALQCGEKENLARISNESEVLRLKRKSLKSEILGRTTHEGFMGHLTPDRQRRLLGKMSPTAQMRDLFSLLGTAQGALESGQITNEFFAEEIGRLFEIAEEYVDKIKSGEGVSETEIVFFRKDISSAFRFLLPEDKSLYENKKSRLKRVSPRERGQRSRELRAILMLSRVFEGVVGKTEGKLPVLTMASKAINAIMSLRMDDYTEGVREWKRTVRKNGAYHAKLAASAVLAEKMGDLAVALDHYRQAAEEAPQNPKYAREVARLNHLVPEYEQRAERERREKSLYARLMNQ